MTKPTYSELEAENLRVRGLLQRQWISVEERLPELQELVLLANDGELELGLRGLDGQEWFWCDADGLISEKFYEFGTEGSTVTHWMPLPNFPQSSSLVSQAAESADIGKHSCADELCDGHCDDPDCPKRKRMDIGKLDTVDKSVSLRTRQINSNLPFKSGVEMGKVNRVEEKADV